MCCRLGTWLKHSVAFMYAEDTSSTVLAKTINEVKYGYTDVDYSRQ